MKDCLILSVGYCSIISDYYVYSLNSQKMVYSGCPGKIFRFTLDQYMSAVFIRPRCAILCMANGVVIVQVVAKIMLHGIRILSSD